MSRFDYIKYDQHAQDLSDMFKQRFVELEGYIMNTPASTYRMWAIGALETCFMYIGKCIRDDQLIRTRRLSPLSRYQDMPKPQDDGAIPTPDWFNTAQQGSWENKLKSRVELSKGNLITERGIDREYPMPPPKYHDSFMDKKRLEAFSTVVNVNAFERGSNTPDFILGQFLTDVLNAFDTAVNKRGEWWKPEVDDEGKR